MSEFGKSVALSRRRPPLDFRYAPLAIKLARHCNMPPRADIVAKVFLG
jgi:hypothetical protein